LTYELTVITFVEDERFTAAADRLLSDDERFDLMLKLATTPDAGDIIPHSGGCRKLRLAAKGKGSRGGARVIYFHRSRAGQILLLEFYTKNEESDVSPAELWTLKRKMRT
jgi:hypothetical protein